MRLIGHQSASAKVATGSAWSHFLGRGSFGTGGAEGHGGVGGSGIGMSENDHLGRLDGGSVGVHV